MPAFFLIILSSIILGLPIGSVCKEVDSSAAAAALLRGVATRRNEYRSIKAELILETRRVKTDRNAVSYHFNIEQSNGKRRCEQLSDSIEPSVYIISEDAVSGFIRRPSADLDLFDLSEGVGRRGIYAFDPKIIGLANIHAAHASVDGLLWLERYDSITHEGAEKINGVIATRIKLTQKDMISEFWISESDFRVHKRTNVWERSGETAVIESIFNGDDPTSPFPTEVSIRSFRDGQETYDTLKVITMNLAAEIAPQRFEIASIGLPINTMINDYRINRIVGYWDGSKISPDPVLDLSNHEKDELKMSTSNGMRWLVALANVIVLLLLGVLFLWSKRRRPR
ncbi:hypothetical protein [Schlesneria paludicola]|uniref:hypothetical protein n=1 Tax=Schlesneria paludicola TaxID=360056 RepID=UPI001ED96095|nr:hypothetical protein [Schlesneria paludicola]